MLRYIININIIVSTLYIFFTYVSLEPNKFLSSLISLYQPYSIDSSILFLAHGIRVIGTMLWGYLIYPGVFMGQIITGYLFFNLQLFSDNNLTLSMCSLLPFPLVSYALFKSIKGVDFEKIQLKNIFLVAILSSLLSSYFSTSYKNFIEPRDNLSFFSEASNFIIGDVLGAIVLFYIVIWIYRSINLIRKKIIFK